MTTPFPLTWTRRVAALALGLTALGSVATVTLADSPTDSQQALYEAGLTALARGEPDLAVVELERLIANRGFSPGALVALGVARAARGDHARAIVAYERALLLDPDDPARIRERLRAAYEALDLEPPARPWYRTTAGALTDSSWIAVGLSCAALFLLAVVSLGLRWRGRPLHYALAALGAAGAVAATGALYVNGDGAARTIALETADALVSPVEGAEPVFTVREGEEVLPIARRGDSVQIRSPSGGATGWVPARAIDAIDPRTLDRLPTL